MFQSKYFLILILCFLVSCNPFKVTDPADPRFDPMKFDFNDYQHHEEMVKVLRHMFKPGISRTEVEKILVKIGKARILDHTENSDFGYALDHDDYFQYLRKNSKHLILYQRGDKPAHFLSSSGWSGWFVYTFYDEKDQIIEMYEDDTALFNLHKQ